MVTPYQAVGIPDSIVHSAPLISTEVIVNPETDKYDTYTYYYGHTGYIVDPNGSEEGVLGVIKKMKQGTSSGHWTVSVFFPSLKRTESMDLRYLLPTHNDKEIQIVSFKKRPGSTITRFVLDGLTKDGQNFEEVKDDLIIARGMRITNVKLYDNAYRQKLLEKA